MRVLLVYNPKADSGKAGKILPEVKSLFEKEKIDFDLIMTEYPGHGTEIVREADFSSYNGIIAAGGDGTVFEVLNGYYQNDSKHKIPLGVLPNGTGNAFVRDLDLTGSDTEKALKIIAGGKTRKVDVGRYRTANKSYHFINIMGLGFVTDVVESAIKLKVFGNIGYTLGVFYQTLFLKSNRLSITMDGNKLERDCIFVEINNTRWASNFLMAPKAVFDDGLLDITLVNKISRRRLLQIFPKVFTGEHVHEPEIETFRAQKIHIETDQPKTLSPDGELIGKTPVTIDCLHQDMEVFWK